MTIFGMLYKLLIGPLELLFEVIFVIANRKVSNPALAIIALSLAMNFLVLPLYRRADAMQAEERDREARMRPWIDHIKKTFKGDERFMMLQTYYRQNNYKPTHAFKGSVSLFLEIPFFIAAYRFLSGLEILKGVSFGPIADLGAPDAMIQIGGISVNVLPILMTLINLTAAAIYMKGMPLKNKIQMYGIAGIFLVLLYNSPAGLVFYWTLNNIFSLLKNIFYKIKDPAKVLRIGASVIGLLLLAYVIIKHPMRSTRGQIMVIALLLCLQLPVLFNFLKNRGMNLNIQADLKRSRVLFLASAMMLTVLTGLLCPSAVIADSTEEFINVSNYVSPNWYIVSAFLLAAGTFLVWCGVFYGLADNNGKHVISFLMAVAAVVGLVNYMVFGKDYGNLSSELMFDDNPTIPAKAILINLAVSAILFLGVYLIWRHKPAVLSSFVGVLCVSLIIMSAMNVISINKVLAADSELIKTAQTGDPELSFSKDGKNVVVIMMDRMAGFYIPYIVAEKPELKEMWDGFTYYSNVTSHATTTNEGAPSLYGGYDYTPARINERDTEPVGAKNDEALKVMPTLFGEAGYDVTICDPTYAGYKQIPDLTIFNDHPEYKTYNLNGMFSLEEYGYVTKSGSNTDARYRNFFCYSLFRIAPTITQKTLYSKGTYNSSASVSKKGFVAGHTMNGSSKSHGFGTSFMKHYATLSHLSDITKLSDSEGSFMMMSNDTTHDPVLLQEPSYTPALDVDNTEYDAEHPVRVDDNGNTLEFENNTERIHYHVNMASMLKLGEWFEYLKKEGVYDNTRIIIVSDHGTPYRWRGPNSIYYTDEDTGEEKNLDIRRFQCTLMCKDFDAEGFTVNDDFATNADVPAIALEGIVDNPVNPFTGNAITRGDESLLPLEVARTSEHNITKNNGNTFTRSNWFVLNGPVRDLDSWEYIGNR